ncbi:hypothetical protein CTAYLR_009080 [Chrysophaeum taylorii]|uniref:UBC core domain-containing protein n=1 Tax=Chrysophaeum taylorii TaxID=2483200 RepID=A0AAD7UKE3_9STRA|nr:hypothetical protein CTAYLR_009080 [Chrysophaeum taylorii]
MSAVIDLTGDEEEGNQRPRKKARKTASEPAWGKRRGVARIMGEFKSLLKAWGSERPKISDLELVRDVATTWQFKVRDFDDCPGGRQLNADLERLSKTHGQNFILMEIQFPDDYPTSPFFLRCVSPRFVWYTGHVTAGGSICIEALTTSGTPGSWHPSHCVEAVLRMVFFQMINAESGYVRTANGGGPTGPLRVDLHHRYTHDVLAPYSPQEARSAYSRMLHHHQRHGW